MYSSHPIRLEIFFRVDDKRNYFHLRQVIRSKRVIEWPVISVGSKIKGINEKLMIIIIQKIQIKTDFFSLETFSNSFLR